MFRIMLLFLILSTTFSLSAQADPAGDQLGVCLVDALNGKERKMLAQWVFFAMASHPEIRSYANITATDKDQADQFLGTLVTRLLTEDCPEQARAAFRKNSHRVFEQAFGLVGQVAMQELMTDSQVKQGFSSFEKYLDKDKLAALDQ